VATATTFAHQRIRARFRLGISHHCLVNINLAQVSIRGNIEDALSEDLSKAAQACRVLAFVGSAGRLDAVVFLLGLLSFYRDDLKRLEAVAAALEGCAHPVVANALFGELARVKSCNQNRTYLNIVIKSLSRFPKDLVADRFQAMSEDTSLSPKMRSKFLGVADSFYESPWDDDDRKSV